MSCIIQNLPTVFICLGLCAVLSLSALVLIRDKKKGKSTCGSCSNCALSGSCHKSND